MKKLSSIIVDDEPMARELLLEMLNEYCPDVEVLELCQNLPEGVKAIKKHRPELVFLDIEMPGYSGLELLDFFNENEVDFSIIFTTAYNEFAIQAFKLSAIDYLLKPIESDELQDAVARYIKNHQPQNLSSLRDMLEDKTLKKISITTQNAVNFIDIESIVYLKAEGSYTKFVIDDGSEIISSKYLKQFEDVLNSDNGFFRCHKSYSINLKFVSHIDKTDGMKLYLKNNEHVSISNVKVDELLSIMSQQ